jgi:hypothetical protein
MDGRVLRIELRRSAAIWAAALSFPLVFAWSEVHEGMSAVVGTHRSDLTLLVPLALGVGAWQARRDRRSRTTELIATTARAQWHRYLHTAVALGIGALAGFLVVFVGLVGYALVVGAYVPLGVLASAAVTALCLAAALWLGLGIGRVVSWVAVPPLIVLAGMVAALVLAFATDTEGFIGLPPPGTLLLNPMSTTGFDAFETLTAPARLAQAAWLAAIAAACLIFGVATRRVRLLAIVPLALGLVVSLALLPRTLREPITLDQDALALICTDPDEPQVCTRRMHPLVLDELRRPGRQALQVLSAKLPQAPTRVVEAYYGNDAAAPPLERRADTLWADLPTDGAGRIETPRDDIVRTLLMGAGTLPCPDVGGAFGPRYNAARLIAAAWLLDEQPGEPDDPDDPAQPDATLTGPAYDALLALPPDEQRARVAALREAELTCASGDRLDLLVGDGAAP